MKTNSMQVTLPIVNAGVGDASPGFDVGGGYEGFAVQFVNVTAAAGVHYVVEGSLDGQTWGDMTGDLLDVGHGRAASAATITVDSIYDYPWRFPGQVRVRCSTAPGAPPVAPVPVAVLAYQDTRQT